MTLFGPIGADVRQQKVKDWMKIALEDFTERMPPGVKFAAVTHL